MKGYDTLHEHQLPSAPPPYSAYNHQPVSPVNPMHQQPQTFAQHTSIQMVPAHHTRLQVNQSRECCCCCCTCPFWVCCLIIAFIIFVPALIGILASHG